MKKLKDWLNSRPRLWTREHYLEIPIWPRYWLCIQVSLSEDGEHVTYYFGIIHI